ncbi:MAG: ester cyclase [Chloroflexi bacterium]|nr:ester cyclase [Chloroflexota bacterium]
MPDQDHGQIVKRFASAFNSRDLDAVMAPWHERGRVQDPAIFRLWRGQQPRMWGPLGPAAARALYERWLAAFPDARLILSGLWPGGDTVTLEFTLAGTHQGQCGEFAPTGNRVGVSMAGLFRFFNGQILELRLYYDTATLASQLQAPSQAPAAVS